jgi:hypothetical protein
MSNEDIIENEGAATQVDFALTPGRFQSDKVIDYSTESGRKLYKGATDPLKSLHDLSAENLRDFITLLEQRAKIYDWVDILEIPDEENQTFIHMLKQYGSISLKTVREHAKTYVNNESRAAQDSQQLADCILNSITVEARNSVTLCEDEYTIGEVVSGTCLLKVVVRESHIDTNATTRIIREQLTKLDSYMVSIDSDVLKFNEHVKDLLKKLKARGAITHDLLANLFKAYKATSDKEFVKYIDQKKNDYDEGINVTPIKLMLLAANKYKTMKQDNEWNAPSIEQEQIIALRAQINKLKVSKANKDNKPNDKETDEGPQKTKSKWKRRDTRPSWMFVAPKQGEPDKKTVKGKVWHWCNKHQAWGKHLQSECRGKGYYPNKRTHKDGTPDKDKMPPNKKLKIANALSSILEDEDSE